MMMETRDPAIKLFGMNIPFPAVFDSTVEMMEWSGGDGREVKAADKVTLEISSKRKKNSNNSPNNSHDSKLETGDKEETIESNDSPQQMTDGKTLKKPTKILPCPRCKSMDTKFCYYNNYNINQPRHFCKACQRYWTAGGTMRNVPVGAGRRKNKSSSSHYRHITISEALEAARLDSGLQASTRLLSFGPEAQQQLQGDQKLSNGARNGRLENGDDCSSGSSVTTCNNHSMDESRAQSCRVVEPQINNMNGYACIPSVPWPYTWNPAMPPPGFYPPPGYPMPFYPYWTVPMLSASARKEKETEQKQGKGCVLVPKTLRIDDPEEAAKSSIWTTLGIKNEGMSMFKGFSKDNNNDKAENSTLLSANPAALSRSNNFHERI